MNKKIFLALVILISPILAAAQDAVDKREIEKLLADSYAAEGNTAEAARIYEKILAASPGDRDAKKNLADILSWEKDYKRSIGLYDELLADKDNPEIRRQKARVLGWAKAYGLAEKEYQKITAAENAGVYEIEAAAKRAYWKNRVKTAIREYEELVKKEPGNTEAMFDLAQIYSYQRMWKEADSEYRKILDIYPGHFRAREGLEKTKIISRHIRAETGYTFFEADSPGRVMDMRENRFTAKAEAPIAAGKALIQAGYSLVSHAFSDYPMVTENGGCVKLSYFNMPDWTAAAYYGILGYNRGVDEYTHVFGGEFTRRIFDTGTLRLTYDKRPLENISRTLREHDWENDLAARADIDVTKRLKLGADYLYSYYSDNNTENRPGIDILYYAAPPPTRLLVKYRYFYREFRKKDALYFAPKGFSTNMVSVDLRHYLNKNEIFFGADDLYYGLRYDVSLDSENIAGHKLGCSFGWDINKRLSVYASFSVMVSSCNVYNEKTAEAGVRYYF